jgi:opacity protein-like surface antigen
MLKKTLIVAGALFLALAVAGLAAQTTKIRVKTPNAVLRLEPSASGEIAADKIAAGTVFDSERKVGTWFEVKHRSAIGVLLVAFISEADVEVVTPGRVTAPPEKPVVRESGPPSSLKPGLVLSLGAGLGMTSYKGGSSEYSRGWDYLILQYVDEYGEISGSIKNPISLGLGLGYFFTPNIGLQLRLDYQLNQSLSGNSYYAVDWKFTTTSDFSQELDWPVGGSFSVMPISLDLVGRFALGSSLRAYLNAGVSYFTAKIEANSTVGVADSWLNAPYLFFDYYAIPARINASLNGIGFNIGAALEMSIGRTMGLFLEAQYFLGPTKTEPWRLQAGVYPGYLFTTITWTVQGDLLEFLKENRNLTDMEIPLSFFKFGAGIKIGL